MFKKTTIGFAMAMFLLAICASAATVEQMTYTDPSGNVIISGYHITDIQGNIEVIHDLSSEQEGKLINETLSGERKIFPVKALQFYEPITYGTTSYCRAAIDLGNYFIPRDSQEHIISMSNMSVLQLNGSEMLLTPWGGEM